MECDVNRMWLLRFYYADQRQANGGIFVPPDAPAHAATYLELAQDVEQRPWNYTFVKGVGYTAFDDAENMVDIGVEAPTGYSRK